jgi:hypothetical protein
MPRRLVPLLLLMSTLGLDAGRARGGVVNPDISVLGQPFLRWTDDPLDHSPRRVRIDQGEVEMVFDSYLNPYAKGYFVTSLTTGGLDLEEGYFTVLRGLPADLQLKGGKYRVNFGKLNPMHYGEQHIIPSGSGDSAPMAEGSPIFLYITMSGIRRSPAVREARSLRPYFDQEGQCS